MLCQINQKKPQKTIIVVGKLFKQCVYVWRGFAEGVVQIVLFTILCFK